MSLKKVSDHFLVPKHEIVPKERVEELVKEFGTNLESFPKIFHKDAAAEEIGAKRGDVIKITRKSKTAGKAVYYRVVM